MDIDTLNGKKRLESQMVKVVAESLYNGTRYLLENVVCFDSWNDNVESLPHNRDLHKYKHFAGVQIVELEDRDSIDLILEMITHACLP